MTDHPSIDAYLERARAVWDEADGIPPADRLRSIAEQVDMSSEASNAADERAADLTRQAQQSIRDGDDDRAESLLRDALLLSPVRLQPFYLLADLYARRYGDHGDRRDRSLALECADRAHQISPSHDPTRAVVEKIGDVPQDGLSWRKAAMIVGVIVVISATLQLCHRFFFTPEVTDEQTQEVREYLEERGPHPR